MTTIRHPDSVARDRAQELIRAFDGRAGSLGSLLGRVTPVDQVGVEERVDALRKRSIKSFRFGASSPLNDILMQIEKERTGRYQGPDHFTID